MSVRSRLFGMSNEQWCALCWAWVVAVGTAMVAFNVTAGYHTRAKVVGLLMVLGAAVYVADMLSSMYRHRHRA
jgi:hypothetical protein